MQILKNKYVINLVVLIVFLFFIGEGLESLSYGKTSLAVVEFLAAAASVVLVVSKRRKDKKEREEEEE